MGLLGNLHLVPSLRISAVNVTIATAVSETNPPLKKPYRIAKMMRPGLLSIPIQQSARSPETKDAGISTLRGPTLSAMKLGRIRPATDAAFRIGSK